MTDLNSLIDIAVMLQKYKTHLYELVKGEEGKWFSVEACLQMPMQKAMVPVAVRTMRGSYTDLAAWTSRVYTDEYIEGFLLSSPNQEQLLEFTRSYVASIQWYNLAYQPLVGVMCWYRVPPPFKHTIKNARNS